jgi:D-xylonolactonase
MDPELVADYRCETGEGPLWHPMERQVYWSDIPQGRIFRLNPFTRRHEQIYDGRIVGGFTIQSSLRDIGADPGRILKGLTES